jgi:predicted DsbA family dithiol-disulfide isomerase
MDALAQRYGFDPNAHHVSLFGENGLPHTPHTHIPNSHAALNVAELGRQAGVHPQLHERLMTAFWAEDRDISDPAVLAEEAQRFGLDRDAVVDAATTKPYEGLIQASTQGVTDMGAGGVPAFVVDDRVLIPGAQPHELFEKVMDKFGHGSVESTDDSAPESP